MVDQKGFEGFFSKPMETWDKDVAAALNDELGRQNDGIELIASENIVSHAVMQAAGSVAINKYAEGYPGKRYYAGCAHVDVVESLAIERAKQLFGVNYVNVQPHSGAQANGAVFLALMKPGDCVLGMKLAHGGHLSHGAAPNISGKWFDAHGYGIRLEDGRIDYDEVEALALEHRPKMIIAGGSAYPRQIDFHKFRKIADKVGALLLVDMAHFAGLVAAGEHPSPAGIADVITTTTHKTLRSARGGMILTNDEAIAKKINSAVFPGFQGGPLMQSIAGKAVGLGEALRPEFKTYIKQVCTNAKALSARLKAGGLDIVSGGTDTHLMLVDLRPMGLTGLAADKSLENAGITCNKNAVPNDPEKPMVTSGIRLGTPAATTRGFKEAEFEQTADLILEVLAGLKQNPDDNSSIEHSVHQKVTELCHKFPLYARPF
ncbi:MAG: serine hydroxymethyltransferase [Alphaproteobacteria bacterium]